MWGEEKTKKNPETKKKTTFPKTTQLFPSILGNGQGEKIFLDFVFFFSHKKPLLLSPLPPQII